MDLTLPTTSYFTGGQFSRELRGFLSGDIQDLMIAFFCTSTDIVQSKLRIHKHGPLPKYVRASMNLAGYMPPVCDNGALLLDGGYLNNLPADVMRQAGASVVIAVDVAICNSVEFDDWGESLSGWRMFLSKMNPFRKLGQRAAMRAPSMTDINSQLIYTVNTQETQKIIETEVDWYFHPPIEDYGIMEFDKYDDFYKIGYEHVQSTIAKLAANAAAHTTED